MDSEDSLGFEKMWSDIWHQRAMLLERLASLETDVLDARNKIIHLDEMLKNLAPLAGRDDDGTNISGLGITDAIRSVLKTSGKQLSAQDIRRLLNEKGFDLSGLTAPMSSIYKILSRLVDGTKKEVDREKGERGVFYRWKSIEITDDDIPF